MNLQVLQLQYKCVFSDGTSASCSVKGSKSDQDIAVAAVSLSDISSDTASNIAIAELEDSSDIKVGQQVVAIGNALMILRLPQYPDLT